MTHNTVAVLGGGITGLTVAYDLSRKGFEVAVLEKNEVPGGMIETEDINGVIVERGLQMGLENTAELIRLLGELGLQEEITYANTCGDVKYILKDNALHPIPLSLHEFFKSDLLTMRGKLKLLNERFASKTKDGYTESVAAFAERRMGPEVLKYIINPLVAETYAGEPEKLSIRSAFPKLFELEQQHGGIVPGTVKWLKQRKEVKNGETISGKLFTFANGMATLPKALHTALGSKVHTLCDVISVEKNETGYRVTFSNAGRMKSLDCAAVVSAIPAYAAAKVFTAFGDSVLTALQDIPYAPLFTANLLIKKSDLSFPAYSGYGILLPSSESRELLNAVFLSRIFDHYEAPETHCITLHAGGTRNPELFELERESIVQKIAKEFFDVTGIRPLLHGSQYKYWNKAIPQYSTRHHLIESKLDSAEKENPGIHFTGNYRNGITLGDCVRNAYRIAIQVETQLHTKRKDEE